MARSMLRGSLDWVGLSFLACWTCTVQARTLCDDLKVLQNTKADFAEVRGVAAPGDKWRTNPPDLTGIGECLISRERVHAQVTCTSEWMTDEATARTKVRTLIDAVQACLGVGYEARTNQLGESLTTTGFHRLGSPTFSVALYRQNSGPGRWQIWLGATMRAEPLPPPADGRAAEPVELAWRSEASWCSDLQKVAVAAGGKFESIKGRKHRTRWLPTQTIGGMSDCAIHRAETLTYYSCTAATLDSESKALKVFDAMAVDLKKCLAPPWSARVRKSAYSGLPRMSYASPTQPGNVELRVTDMADEFEVKIDIDAED